MKNFKTIIQSLVFALIFTIGAGYAIAWTGPKPGTVAPDCSDSTWPGCSAPINVSRVDQIKAGAITVGTSFIAGGSNPTVSLRTLGGQIAFGTAALETVPTGADLLRVLIKGNVGAAKYCDEFGKNCHASSEFGDGVPLNAVMAFAGSCPAGGKWLPANSASGTVDLRGKNIIGAYGTYYPYGTPGGASSVTLNANQLPKHSHLEVAVSESASKYSSSLPGGGSDRSFGSEKTSSAIYDISGNSVGAQTNVNVMDPYLPLTYCQKMVL